MGQHPVRAGRRTITSRLYASNFGSNSVAVYDIDIGRRIATMPVGSRPDGLALSQDQRYLLVLDTQAGDVTVIQKRNPRKLEPTEYSLLTMIPVGVQPERHRRQVLHGEQAACPQVTKNNNNVET